MIGLGTLAVAAAAPAAAAAATLVEQTPYDPGAGTPASLSVVGDAHDQEIVVEVLPDPSLPTHLITDRNGAVTAGEGCIQVSASSAECDFSADLDIALGAGDDFARLPSHGGYADGRIDGGPGDDRLLAGWARDTVHGGPGDDRMTDATFRFVTIGRAPDAFFGGPGSDLIKAGNAADDLDGGTGQDRLFAGSEDDLLIGGPGADALRGQNGEDELHGEDGTHDLRLSCGQGLDYLFRDSADAGLADSCETTGTVHGG